jgi:hypothetical protein
MVPLKSHVWATMHVPEFDPWGSGNCSLLVALLTAGLGQQVLVV